ncbi:MAG: ABC transporter permease [Anaerolineales bacterium]
MKSLRAYVITRFLLTIPMVLILLIFVFILLRVMPGDPVEATMRPGVPEEYKNQIRHNLGLDRPLFINTRGTKATLKEDVLVLYEEKDPQSEPVMLALEEDTFPITDRYKEEGEDWIRVTIEADEPSWIAEEKSEWLRQVEFHFKEDEDATPPPGVEGEWIRITLSKGGVEGWGPAESFDIQNNPFDSQFFSYLWGLVTRFDLGKSITLRGRPIAADLVLKFPATVELGIFGILVAGVVGVFSGAFAAQNRRSPIDYSLRIYSIVAYAVPIFWLGLMFQLIFGVALGWMPVSDRISSFMRPDTITEVYALGDHLTGAFGEKIISILDFLSGFYVFNCLVTGQWASLLNALRHLFLPSMTLGLYLSGNFTRLTRANMLDVLQQDFIAAARARGIKEKAVVYKHALQNAFIPILTMFGMQFALLMSGAVLTETTFNWPGMGLFLVNRVIDRDFPAIQGTIVFFALIIASANLIVDIIYARIDPRVRY